MDLYCNPVGFVRTAGTSDWTSLCNSPLNQVCWSHRRSIPFVSHGQELCPVATETLRVDPGVYNESPVGTASGFLPQGQTHLPFSHVMTDVNHLYHQKM